MTGVGAVIVVAWLVGCGGSHGLDGGIDGDDVPTMDAPPGDDAPSPTEDASDVGVDADSCEGYEQGYTIRPGETRMCCKGRWWHFFDGPCLPGTDAGGGDAGGPCAVDPHAAGCPCGVAGDVYCTPSTWRMECTGGVWTKGLHIACCPGETTA